MNAAQTVRGTVLDGVFDADAARSIAELDAAEQFPAEFCRRLNDCGLADYYVPTEWGGRLDDHEMLLGLWRTIAAHDLSIAVAHGKTYLGTACVWLAGNPAQAASTADVVRIGAPVAWALSEPEHGADLLRGAMTATAVGGGYRLNGVKWPVNNATRARHLTVLARTGSAGDPRGHSLFQVDKVALPSHSWHNRPKVATHGIRGVDISGIEFTDARVSNETMLGEPGSGIETVLRALQLTRTACAALSLGAGEHALRLGSAFTAERIIQGRPLIDRPYPRSILARCASLLAAVEVTAAVGNRSIHALTGEMSVGAAVVKALAPTLVEAIISDLADVLGARSFLTDVYAHGAFQKIARDHQVVAVFDGSTPVNRAALAQQFGRLARGFTTGVTDDAGLARAVSIGEPLPPLNRGALALLSVRGCSVVQSLPALVESIAAASAPEGLVAHARALHGAAALVCTRMADLRPTARPQMVAYELAAAYELCYAGAACLHAWAASAPAHIGEPLWIDGLWVRAALRALLTRLSTTLRSPVVPAAPGDDVIDDALCAYLALAVRSGDPLTPFGRRSTFTEFR